MSTFTKPNDIANGGALDADPVDENFDDIYSNLNNSVMHKDASAAFTGIPSGPATDPTTVNQLTRKAYVDAGDLPRAKARGTAWTKNPSGTVNPATSQTYVIAESVVATTNGSGVFTVTFPSAFPTGCITVVACDGDTGSNFWPEIITAAVSASGFTCQITTVTAGALATLNNTQVRVNYIAYGY